MNKLSRSLAFAAGALALSAATFAQTSDFYQRRNLTANTPALRVEHLDRNVVNAWGLAFNPYAFAWVANNGTGVATLFDGTGRAQPLVVTIPGIKGQPGNPTGIVFYGGPGFVVSKGSASGPSRFLFASEDGGISAWSPQADPTHAIRMVDNSASHAIYKGLAISGDGRRNLLYATDFHNDKIDVYDSNFRQVNLPGRPFEDLRIPSGYGPFGIQAIGGNLFVTYARQDAAREDDVKGPGLGFVDVFAPDGRLLRRFASNGPLNAPWGITLAPEGFGRFSNRLLVGNFGDGTINAYDLASGQWLGELRGPNRQPIRVDGLWGLAFGNGVDQQRVDTLYFTAGPNREANGLFGRINVLPGNNREESAPAE